MFTTSWAPRLLPGVLIPGFFVMSVLGCVSSSTYEAAKKEAQDLRHELQQEQLKRETIEQTYGQQMKEMEDLVAHLTSAVKEYDAIAKNWGGLRDELTMLRVNRELERQRGHGGIGIVLEGDATSSTPLK